MPLGIEMTTPLLRSPAASLSNSLVADGKPRLIAFSLKSASPPTRMLNRPSGPDTARAKGPPRIIIPKRSRVSSTVTAAAATGPSSASQRSTSRAFSAPLTQTPGRSGSPAAPPKRTAPLTAGGVTVLQALALLKDKTASRSGLASAVLSAIASGTPLPEHEKLIARMGLESPGNMRQRLYRRLLGWALRQAG